MPSYILFLADRRELRLRCGLCGEVVVLTTAAEFADGRLRPDPRDLVGSHYRGDRLARNRCSRWNDESQDFYVKDPRHRMPTTKFSWPNADDEEDYAYYIHCLVCGEEEGYSGPLAVGEAALCEICDDPLVRHEITVSAGAGDPNTLTLPRFS